VILPVIVGPSLYSDLPLGVFGSVNPVSEPLIRQDTYGREETFLKVARRVLQLVSVPERVEAPAAAPVEPDGMLGRRTEITTLLEAWRTAREAPTVALLHGPTGHGKTSLVQALYRRMAAAQPEPYWPPVLTASLVPSGRRPDDTRLPWLWLAMRCVDPEAVTNAGAGLRPLETLRDQAREQLGGIYAGSGPERTAVTLTATFALPGTGTAVEIGSKVAEHFERDVRPSEAAKDLREYAGNLHARPTASDPDAMVKAFATELVETLRALVEHVRTPAGEPLPIVLVADDAHWADDNTVALLEHVTRTACDEQWPLLMIVSAWDEALRGSAPLAGFIDWVRAREQRGPDLAFWRVPVKPLDPGTQHELIEGRLPDLPPRQHDILLERSRGDLELLKDYCLHIENTPQWRDAAGHVVVSDEDLRSLPGDKAEMARSLLRSAGLPLRNLLALGSAQGWKFYGAGTSAMLRAREADSADTIEQLFDDADHKYRICAVMLHDVLGHTAEFRAYPYYEISRESFEQLHDRDELLRVLADTLREQYDEDRFASLSAIDRVEVMADLVEAGGRLGLRDDPAWRDVLDECALDVAALQVSLGHLEPARRTAETVLAHAEAASVRGQRALAVLCEAAHAAGDAAVEDELLDRWWEIPEEHRSEEAFLRRARRDIRDGRGHEAVHRLDRLLEQRGREPHERLLYELERARALCYSDEAHLAPRAVDAIERALAAQPFDDPAFAARLDHTAYIAAHNLERNADAADRARDCMDRYERVGLREGRLLSMINLGDALWGLGRTSEAQRRLREAHQETVQEHYAHPRALAAICIANVIAADVPEEAAALYDEGIGEAVRARWKYDELYGGIYRALLRAERSDGDGHALRELAGRARNEHLAYLADIALAYSAMREAELGREPVGADTVLAREGAAPLARLHAAAAVLAAGADEDAHASLFATLEATQGVKGRRGFVGRVATDVARTERERLLAERLTARRAR
jgi:hypothetical protein